LKRKPTVSEFFDAVRTQAFMQNALLTGLLVSVACGIMGTYIVVRRITYIAGGISHAVLGGIGAAFFFQRVYNLQWLDPLYGALAAALLSAVIMSYVSLKAKQREDTVIGAMWAIGMAVGIIFLSRTPGYAEDLMSYLFGNILMVTKRNMWLIGGLDVVVVAAGLLFYKEFMAICFDEEFARLRGIKVDLYYLMLLCLTALTVVLLVTVVGIVLVIALLTLPVAVAGYFSRSLWQMMLGSAVLIAVFTTSGLAFSYGPNLPAGATTIVIAGGVYILVIIVRALTRPKGTRARRPPRGTTGPTMWGR
jgi:zinc transport system permease protein